MAKTDFIRARVDIDLKSKAQEILENQGFTLSSAITIMLRQTVLQGKLPFPIEGSLRLNARAQAISDEHEANQEGLTQHESSNALFKTLGIYGR